MKTRYLSKEEREQGTRYFLNWATMNGLGFSFLGDTIVYLLAIHFGASNLQLGYISSAVHVSGLVLLILPWLLAGKNLIRILFHAWLLRGAVCIFYGGLLFLQGRTAVALILGVYTLFCVSRTFGFAVTAPLQQMLSTSSTMGDFVVTLSNRFQTSRFGSQFLSFLLLSVQQLSGLAGYLFLITAGIITNTLGALQVRRVPCREQVEYRPGQNIFRFFLQSIRSRERALTLFVKWHTLSVMILLSFIVPFLRKIIHLPSNLIFLYTLTGTLATILAGHALRPFTDRVGSRPVLILVSFFLAGFSLVWCFIPASAHWLALFPLMFMTNLFSKHGLFIRLPAGNTLNPAAGQDGVCFHAEFFLCVDFAGNPGCLAVFWRIWAKG